eukprot:scaffold715_cov192-Alexandrium_tamarense.AAC.39
MESLHPSHPPRPTTPTAATDRCLSRRQQRQTFTFLRLSRRIPLRLPTTTLQRRHRAAPTSGVFLFAQQHARISGVGCSPLGSSC